MPKKLGIAIVAMGAVLIISALLLFLYNRREDARAGQEAESLLANVEAAIPSNDAKDKEPPSQEELTPEMPVVMLSDYEYVGYLTIPSLGLKLPVMADSDYARLRLAPCRQFGSSRTDDLVIAAHNYESHFGKLGSVSVGDNVIFTDMDGVENHYIVQKTDILQPTDVDAVEHSGYDLVLYTCTYGGKTRITVFCDRIAEPAA